MPDGSISFQLNVDATVIASPYGFVAAEEIVVFQFNSAGQIQPNAPAAAAQIYSNLELSPQNANGLGTYYLVTFYDANGARINKNPMWWQFQEAAGSTVDIGEMTPYSVGGGNIVFYPILGGGGTVTSVSFTGDGILFQAAAGPAVTTAGTLTPVLNTQSPNTVLAGPVSGSSATPTFRGLNVADLPTSGTWNFSGTITGVTITAANVDVVFVTKTSSYAPSAADHGTTFNFVLGSDATLTLPATSPGVTWWIAAIVNGSGGNLTIDPNGNLLDGSSASQTLSPSSGNFIYTDGTNYFLFCGSVAQGIAGQVAFYQFANQVTGDSLLTDSGTILAYTGTGGITASQTAITKLLAAASQATFRLTDSELSLTFAGSTTITGSVAGIRGNITQAAGNTIAGGYEYGVQGKLTLAGTLANGSGFNAGIFGQLDTSAAGFVHTSGYLAPIMGDFGATSIMASDANANMIALLNTTNCLIHSALLFTGNASYLFDVTDLAYGGAHFVAASSVSPSALASTALAVKVNGTTLYLPLYTAAGGSTTPTQTIASGSQALGTTLIASGAAASTITVAATGVLTTDNLLADFNADPTGTTGYAPSASGMLTIIKFCSSGHVNFIVVNNTGSGITPGAVTLNWRVVR